MPKKSGLGQCDGVIVDGADEEEESEYDMWNVRYMMEGPLWASVRVFLVHDDVLCMRTTAAKWQGCMGPLPRYDNGQLSGFPGCFVVALYT